MNRAIEAAYDRVHRAEKERDAIIKKTYAVGDRIAYMHGQYAILADVVDHSCDRLKVRSLKDGREHWIGAYRVI